MRALLVRVGADCTEAGGRWNGPVDAHTGEILKTRDTLNKILSDNTGQPLDRIKNDTERDYFMSSPEAKEYGLIDHIMSRKPSENPTAK